MITKFVHTGKKADQKLFALVGAWIVSQDVHNVLGVAITSQVDDIWHVCIDQDQAEGFVQTRILKNGKAHIRYLYTEKDETKDTLIDTVIEMAKEMGLKSIYTNDRETVEIWKNKGFEKRERIPRGAFRTWERSL